MDDGVFGVNLEKGVHRHSVKLELPCKRDDFQLRASVRERVFRVLCDDGRFGEKDLLHNGGVGLVAGVHDHPRVGARRQMVTAHLDTSGSHPVATEKFCILHGRIIFHPRFFHFIMPHAVDVRLEIVEIGVRTPHQINRVAGIIIGVVPIDGVQPGDIRVLFNSDTSSAIVAQIRFRL